tara:strand:+ start:396 stop:1565 length:1170 start_codon:yes stop_codon:yes gene_type:complete
MFKNNISIIGGAGHVGFPLGLAFAESGMKVNLVDTNKQSNILINSGELPFKEDKAKKILQKNLKKKKIFATTNIKSCLTSKFIIISVGTPISQKNLKPKTQDLLNFFYKLKKYIKKDQIIIVRSSVYPGICEKIYNILKPKNKNLSYCPERIIQGKSLIELPKLPQIVSGFNDKAINNSVDLFKKISKKIIITGVLEAELIKLFSNAYRYIHFSIANQFYKICEDLDVDFNLIRKNMMQGYNRNKNIPKQGFTGGPCLLKDTMQLAAFCKNNFEFGYAAMNINENLPVYLIKNIKNYEKKKIGILGLSFKAGTDDTRDSLSFKLIEFLKKKKIKYFINDPFVKIKNNLKIQDVIKKSDLIFIATPHNQYRKIKVTKDKILIDVWNITDK